jgi:hypothetical protein
MNEFFFAIRGRSLRLTSTSPLESKLKLNHSTQIFHITAMPSHRQNKFFRSSVIGGLNEFNSRLKTDNWYYCILRSSNLLNGSASPPSPSVEVYNWGATYNYQIWKYWDSHPIVHWQGFRCYICQSSPELTDSHWGYWGSDLMNKSTALRLVQGFR